MPKRLSRTHADRWSRRRRAGSTAATAAVVLALAALIAMVAVVPAAGAKPGLSLGNGPKVTRAPDGLGVRPGAIKHVWLIILENKSYDSTFTGLNRNTYLWRTLPRQGVLLKNYYGTGHNSQDNYISLASGQAPQPDVQNDCPYYDRLTGHVDKRGGSLKRNRNYGQIVSAAGPNAAAGQNGCVYPRSVPTLFNQLDEPGPVEGLRAGPREPEPAGPAAPQRRCPLLRRAVHGARADRLHQLPESRIGHRHRPVRAQALPVPVV